MAKFTTYAFLSDFEEATQLDVENPTTRSLGHPTRLQTLDGGGYFWGPPRGQGANSERVRSCQLTKFPSRHWGYPKQ